MTARRRTVIRCAPGKVFVLGEYAVMEPGNPAILVAVDRQATVAVAGIPRGSAVADVVISSDLGHRSVEWWWRDGRLVTSAAEDERQVRSAVAHVVSAIETVGRLLAERGLALPAMDVSVSSRLHEDGRKLGLGSSGAVTVATVAAVASFCGLELSRNARFRLSLLATAQLDPWASGGDLAASTWGGWLAYQAPDRAFVLDVARRLGIGRMLGASLPGHAVRRLTPPDGLSLEIGWTGEPASTASLVAGLPRRHWRGSPSHRRFVEATSDCVRSAVAALGTGDRAGLLRQIRRARRELARLDDEAGIGIFTPALTALCDTVEAIGGAAKPSGAGGGDCGIALLDAGAARDIAYVRQRWRTAGVLPLSLCPAVEGVTE
ncbi:phosphomevalonate kinase [Streptomyces sp. NPDC014733]|uniref:phosphomevalonate kinase n=1 Tax=Streptomyces sp. NPDC014733 TaxID=3364885 RepID=UPI0037016C02